MKKFYQILEEDDIGYRTVVATGKTKEIALDALRMMPEYNYYRVDWHTPFVPHNMTNTEVTQGILRLS